ncbi:hypothetical protein [Phormidium sp. CCY1219]|nr:hypothetical protein [Phormidium sp. CCY1219]MEB3829133.1 hypothetical protein [Phormidium sp. CCY1219]
MSMHQQARMLIRRNRQQQKHRQDSMLTRLASEVNLSKETPEDNLPNF